MSSQPLRVCYFGTYRSEYSRNQIMIAALRSQGVEVIECHERLWQGIEDRVQTASGGWLSPAFIKRLVRAYWRLLRRHGSARDYDVMVLGYPGQIDVPLARILTWLRRKPLVLDVFMSIFLIAEERGLTAQSPLTGRLIRTVERLALLLPSRLIQDTAEYVAWFGRVYGLEPNRFVLVPTGADDRVFSPVETKRDDGILRVLYYGTFIPNHGIEIIIEAARLLQDQSDVHFELIGDGPTRAEAESLAEQYGLTTVTFLDWVEKGALPHKVAGADLCLGAFRVTPQSTMTVQNKIYEALAMRKCVVTGWSPAASSALIHGEHIWLCDRESAESLAQAVLTLKQSPELRENLAENGYRRFVERFSVAALGRQFVPALESLCE